MRGSATTLPLDTNVGSEVNAERDDNRNTVSAISNNDLEGELIGSTRVLSASNSSAALDDKVSEGNMAQSASLDSGVVSDSADAPQEQILKPTYTDEIDPAINVNGDYVNIDGTVMDPQPSKSKPGSQASLKPSSQQGSKENLTDQNDDPAVAESGEPVGSSPHGSAQGSKAGSQAGSRSGSRASLKSASKEDLKTVEELAAANTAADGD